MKYLAPKLKHRIEIQTGEDRSDTIGYKRYYTTIRTLWAEVKALNVDAINFGTAPVNYRNTEDVDTHKFIVRWVGLQRTGRGYDEGFTYGFNRRQDFNPLKTEYFIFLLGSNTSVGRRFKITRVVNDERFREFVQIKATEIEEEGTGFSN